MINASVTAGNECIRISARSGIMRSVRPMRERVVLFRGFPGSTLGGNFLVDVTLDLTCVAQGYQIRLTSCKVPM